MTRPKDVCDRNLCDVGKYLRYALDSEYTPANHPVDPQVGFCVPRNTRDTLTTLRDVTIAQQTLETRGWVR
jgi:hypothetical protein